MMDVGRWLGWGFIGRLEKAASCYDVTGARPRRACPCRRGRGTLTVRLDDKKGLQSLSQPPAGPSFLLGCGQGSFFFSPCRTRHGRVRALVAAAGNTSRHPGRETTRKLSVARVRFACGWGVKGSRRIPHQCRRATFLSMGSPQVLVSLVCSFASSSLTSTSQL